MCSHERFRHRGLWGLSELAEVFNIDSGEVKVGHTDVLLPEGFLEDLRGSSNYSSEKVDEVVGLGVLMCACQ